ncbi:UNVERIFIED_CONTAM: Retrovirus-related Pol polyprotein from transposon [Sesamum calycinum]|uniref:Retrovirus-related Pol polyprotein from transposon n=1 Tax=Sesamum calycinum TaxID=2727403 RepID=A0AAW2J9G1_9LAMI
MPNRRTDHSGGGGTLRACLTVRPTGRTETKVGHSDPGVPCGRALAQRIKGELRGANPSTRGLGWANLWSTGCYANSSAGQLSWYGTAAQRKSFSIQVLGRGYNQQEGIYYDETFGPVIKMATEDIKHVALRSPIGIYSTKVMPFGLKNAGATYQRAMTNIFKELLHHEVECYVDDLVLQLE